MTIIMLIVWCSVLSSDYHFFLWNIEQLLQAGIYFSANEHIYIIYSAFPYSEMHGMFRPKENVIVALQTHNRTDPGCAWSVSSSTQAAMERHVHGRSENFPLLRTVRPPCVQHSTGRQHGRTWRWRSIPAQRARHVTYDHNVTLRAITTHPISQRARTMTQHTKHTVALFTSLPNSKSLQDSYHTYA
jgi:hypothetical protein